MIYLAVNPIYLVICEPILCCKPYLSCVVWSCGPLDLFYVVNLFYVVICEPNLSCVVWSCSGPIYVLDLHCIRLGPLVM